MKMVFTTGEAADVCKVSQQTIIRCFDAGRVKGFRVPGSRFRRIPRAELVEFMKQHGIPQDGLDDSKRRVLVISSDRHFVSPINKALAGEKYDIRAVTGQFEAGLATQEFLPDLVILDAKTVNAESAEICKAIRQTQALSQVRILASRAHSSEHAEELLKAGCHAHLTEASGERLQDCVMRLIA